MIEINLIPPEMKKKPSQFSAIDFSGFDITSIPVLKISAVISVSLIVLQIIIFLAAVLLNAELGSANKKYDSISSEKEEADALKAKVADINKRSKAIDELVVNRFSWAREMRLLSDSVTSGIWLSELSYDEVFSSGSRKTTMPGAILISGYASGVGEKGTAMIGKFIKSLQDNKSFSSAMASVDLISTKSDKVDSQDVMGFRIRCPFK